ncbi:response regulator transcription factor [Microlunatus spumicola]|uniref:Response regulator transcription factor n=2 Tax=Microlunatus spumicola TaxID=81499 RepID=A0ABP6XXA1_9ACTN
MAMVLLIEDEVGISDFVRRGLESAGFTVVVAADGLSGLKLAQHDDVELVILDLGLPGLPGEQVLARLRSVRPAVPVIVLTAKGAVQDRVTNLEAGANDYVVKPFSFSELLARVRVQLRRPEQTSSVLLEAGGLTLDVRTREVSVDGASATLSSREFTLLEVLMRHPGQVLSQTQLLDQVWGYGFDGASNVVETYVRHLRRKIGAERIQTVRRAGYRLVLE